MEAMTMPDTAEKAQRKPRATAEEKARAKRIERLAFRLRIAYEQIGQVWRDADFPELAVDLTELRTIEKQLVLAEDKLLDSA
jgi:hypothetical protein